MSYIAIETLDILDECGFPHYRKYFIGITAVQLTRLSKLDLENLLPSDEDGKNASCKILLKIAQAQIDGVLANVHQNKDQTTSSNSPTVVVQETANVVSKSANDKDDVGAEVSGGVAVVSVVAKEDAKNCNEKVVIDIVDDTKNGQHDTENKQPQREEKGDADIDKVLLVDNLDTKVTKELIHEVFVQAGPIKKLSVLEGPDGERHMGNCFIQFDQKTSVPRAIDLLKGTKLFGKELKLQSLTGSVHHEMTDDEYCPWTSSDVPAFLQNPMPDFISLNTMRSPLQQQQQGDPSSGFRNWNDWFVPPPPNRFPTLDLTLGEPGEAQPRQVPGVGQVTYIWDENKKIWFVLS